MNQPRMKSISSIFLLLLLAACGGSPQLDITVTEIDAYVADKLSDSQLYDVSQSLRFSHEAESYEVVKFMQDDTVVLYIETSTTNNEQVVRQYFFKHGLPVYIDEIIARNTTTLPFIQRKVYLNGGDVMEAYERQGALEYDLQFLEYETAEVDYDDYDFGKPDRAMAQEGEFQLKFEEFMQIGDQKYIILENQESKFDVALFVTEPTPFTEDLEANEAAYKGRIIFATHQFILMNNVERMLFIEGRFVD